MDTCGAKGKLKMRIVKYSLIVLFPLAFVIKGILNASPIRTENWYSTTVNKVFVEGWSKVTGIFPFSLHELGIYVLILVGIGYLIYSIRRIVVGKERFKKVSVDVTLTVLAMVSVLFFFFTINWGINYGRVPFEQTIGLEVKERKIDELADVYRLLIERTNERRTQVEVDENGVMTIPGGYKTILKRAHLGYEAVQWDYPTLAGSYGTPKPIIASELMNYTGITGIYSPFTAEANVNVAAPIMSIPFTTMHEMAHQRGYSSENEANFIGFLTSIHHPDVDFQYSGYLMALTYTYNALAQNDVSLLKELSKELSEGVRKDMTYKREFWNKYQGTVNTVSDSINNSFLKLNGVSDGVKSYGRMVDLLLAYYAK